MSRLLLNSNYLYLSRQVTWCITSYCIVLHRIALCKSKFLIWYLIELSRNSGGFRNSWRLFESSITFHHILSQPFPNSDKYGNFLKVLLFPSGSFYSMGMKQGLIVSCGNIPKTLFVYICSVWLLHDVTPCYAWRVLNPDWLPICVWNLYQIWKV